jgi:hypothetical protein
MSDSFLFTVWTAIEAVQYLNQDPKFFFELQKSMEDIHEITEKYHLKVFDDSLYDKYRE